MDGQAYFILFYLFSTSFSFDPRGWPTVTVIVFTHVVRPSPLFKSSKTKQQKTMFTTDGMDHWWHSCLVFILMKRNWLKIYHIGLQFARRLERLWVSHEYKMWWMIFPSFSITWTRGRTRCTSFFLPFHNYVAKISTSVSHCPPRLKQIISPCPP